MRYQCGSVGRVFVVRFEEGDDILAGLRDLVLKESVRAAAFNLVGAVKRGSMVTGPEHDEMPPVPVWCHLDESHEVVGFGTVFWQGTEPKIHCHGAFGKRDSARVGCLRECAETFLVIEAVVMELSGITATREPDSRSGMALLTL